jgi:hypothetical protein
VVQIGAFAQAGRGGISGLVIDTSGAVVLKNFPMGEHKSLRIEFAAYNVTNSVQLGYPSVFWKRHPTPANMVGFGEIASASNTPRQVQFATKFSF